MKPVPTITGQPPGPVASGERPKASDQNALIASVGSRGIRHDPQRFSAYYMGPGRGQIVRDGSGDPIEITVSDLYIYGGEKGHTHWTEETFDDTDDIDGNPIASGTYGLCILTDVNPDSGVFDANYGPELVAIKESNLGLLQTYSHGTFTPSGGSAMDLHAAGIIVGLFDADASGHFSQWRQRWQGSDLYQPVHGYAGTGADKSTIQYYHPYDATLDGDTDYGWWECSLQADFGLLILSMDRWMAGHDHLVSQGTMATTGDHTHGGAVSADGDHAHGLGTVNTVVPRWL